MTQGKQVARWKQLRSYLAPAIPVLDRWVCKGADMKADQLVRLGVHAVRSSDQLQRCSFESIYMSLVVAARLGLEPWGPQAEAHIVAYGQTATLLPGYKGLIKLAMESGHVIGARSHVVYDADTFEMDLGDKDRGIRHVVATRDRGAPIGVYAIFNLRDDLPTEYEWMPWSEVEKIRQASRAKNGPWVQWPTEMARKAVLKRGLKQFPLGYRFAQAMDIDHAASDGDAAEVQSIIEIGEDGEVLNIEAPPSGEGKPKSRTETLKDRIKKDQPA